MKKYISLLFLIGVTQTMNAQTTLDEDMKSLKAINAKFIHNFVTNDAESHSKIIHPEFVHITSNGKYTSREEYLKEWVNGFDGFKYWDYRDENIKIFGNTALVHSQNKYEYEKDGKVFKGVSMYTDIYIKEAGGWKCIQAQISNVAPENCASDDTIVRKYDYR